MIIIVFVGFLVFLFCMYFIKNPYFTLKDIRIKQSKSLLASEISLGGIISSIHFFRDTLKYSNFYCSWER